MPITGQDILATMMAAGSTCLSPARRFRLQCMNPLIMAVMTSSGASMRGVNGEDEGMAGADEDKGESQVTLESRLVRCCATACAGTCC